MTKAHKIFFCGVPKSIRRLLCKPTRPRAMMEYDVRKPTFILIDGQKFLYESI